MNKQSSLSNLQNEFILSQERVIKDLHLQLKNHEIDLNNLRLQYNQFKAKSKTAKDDNHSLRQEIHRLKAKIDTLEDRIEQGSQRENELQLKLSQQSQEYGVLNQRFKQKQSQAMRIMNKTSKQKEQVREKQKYIAEAAAENKVLKQINHKLELEMERMQNQLRRYYTDLTKLNQQNATFKKQNECLHNRYTDIKLKYKDLKYRLKNCEQQMYKYQKENQCIENLSKKTHQTFEKDLERITSKLEIIERQNIQYQKNMRLLLEENNNLKDMLRQYRDKLTQQSLERKRLSEHLGFVDYQVSNMFSNKKRYFPLDFSDEDLQY